MLHVCLSSPRGQGHGARNFTILGLNCSKETNSGTGAGMKAQKLCKRTMLCFTSQPGKGGWCQPVPTALGKGTSKEKGLLSERIYFIFVLSLTQLHNLFCTSEASNCTFTAGGRV